MNSNGSRLLSLISFSCMRVKQAPGSDFSFSRDFPEAYKYKKAAVVRVVSLNGDVRNVSNAFFNSAGSTVDVNIAPLALKRGTYLLHVTSVEGRVDILKFLVQ